MVSGPLKFSKEERLCGKTCIDVLFSSGRSFKYFPFRVVCLENNANQSHKVLFSVPRRTFKKAVDRNKIKRRAREAFRLNRSFFPQEKKFDIGLIYIAKEVLPFSFIESKVQEIGKRLCTF